MRSQVELLIHRFVDLLGQVYQDAHTNSDSLLEPMRDMMEALGAESNDHGMLDA